jgi:hypothetical protein
MLGQRRRLILYSSGLILFLFLDKDYQGKISVAEKSKGKRVSCGIIKDLFISNSLSLPLNNQHAIFVLSMSVFLFRFFVRV